MLLATNRCSKKDISPAEAANRCKNLNSLPNGK
jgi:hypothetical protein